MEEEKQKFKISQSFLIDVDVTVEDEWLIFITRYNNGGRRSLVNVLKNQEAKEFYKILVSTEAKRKENINDQNSTR